MDPMQTQPSFHRRRLLPAALVGATTSCAAVAAVRLGARRWERTSDQLLSRIQSSSRPQGPTSYDPNAELAALPEPVRRYFQLSLEPGQRIVERAQLQQEGTFNMGTESDRWKPFSARQLVVTKRPGFLWDARFPMVPGLAARVRDAYVDGQGMLHASLLGLITVADERGTPQMAQGEFMRLLAEAAWFPTALLPSQGVRWEPVDDSSAQATLADGRNRVSLSFRFGADGLIESVHSPARGRLDGGATLPTPWEGRWHDYRRRGRMLVPTRGEVSWLLPDRPHPYWRGRLTSIAYHWSPDA